MKEKTKNQIKQLGSTVIVILIISVVFTAMIIEEQSGYFWEHFPKVIIFVSVIFVIIWIIYKVYNIRTSEVAERDEFIKEVGKDLENLGVEDLENYEREELKELKEEITNIRVKNRKNSVSFNF